jgi:MFS family permease
MSYIRAASIAWTLCVLLIALTAVGLVLTFAGPTAPRTAAVFTKIVLEALIPLVFGGVGAVIIARLPFNTIGWLLMLVALGWTSGGVITGYLPYRLGGSSEPNTVTLLLIWFTGWAWWVLIGPLLSILVLFPTGRPPTPRWRWVVGAIVALFTTFLLLVTLSETLQAPEYNLRVSNPIGILPQRIFNALFVPWILGLSITVTSCVAAVFVRYRRAAVQERTQIKWFLYACSLFLIVYLIAAFEADTLGTWFDVVFNLPFLIIPASIGIAILRYRLYDIDIIIRRTLLYGVLSTILAAIYVGSVIVLQRVVQPLTGSAQSDLVTVVSTLTIVALFGPLRQRLQQVIDRRFYRRKYDAAQTLESFSARLRDETDLGQLTGDLVGAIQQTVQPEHIGLWLNRSQRR